MNSGIYKITNQINNKFYIGSAIDFNKRFSDHVCSLNRRDHYNKKLQNAWNKHGKENFTFEIIEEVLDKSKLIEREQHYLDTLNPWYNVCKSAGNTLGADFYNSKSFKQKMRKSKIESAYYKDVLCKPRSDETKRKMSEAQKGRTLSKNHKAALKNAWKNRNYSGENHPLYGKPRTDDVKKKISTTKKLRKCKPVDNLQEAISFIKEVTNDENNNDSGKTA
jgi:group I intron endonuclease